jgi:hypothetical protein
MGQPMGNPLGAQMGMGAPTQMGPGPGPGPSPVGMTFYNTTLPAGAYGMPLDANGMRYALLPDLDPRVILANRQKKVPLLHSLHYVPTLKHVFFDHG